MCLSCGFPFWVLYCLSVPLLRLSFLGPILSECASLEAFLSGSYIVWVCASLAAFLFGSYIVWVCASLAAFLFGSYIVWVCASLAAFLSGSYIVWLCASLAAFLSGSYIVWVCASLAAFLSGSYIVWVCASLAAFLSGSYIVWVCASLAAFLSGSNIVCVCASLAALVVRGYVSFGRSRFLFPDRCQYHACFGVLLGGISFSYPFNGKQINMLSLLRRCACCASRRSKTRSTRPCWWWRCPASFCITPSRPCLPSAASPSTAPSASSPSSRPSSASSRAACRPYSSWRGYVVAPSMLARSTRSRAERSSPSCSCATCRSGWSTHSRWAQANIKVAIRSQCTGSDHGYTS